MWHMHIHTRTHRGILQEGGDVLNFVIQGAPWRKTGTKTDRFDMHTHTYTDLRAGMRLGERNQIGFTL